MKIQELLPETDGDIQLFQQFCSEDLVSKVAELKVRMSFDLEDLMPVTIMCECKVLLWSQEF